MRGIPFIALDNSAAQVDVIRKFGGKVYFGDSSRTDLLRAAGAAKAKIVVVAVSDSASSLRIVDKDEARRNLRRFLAHDEKTLKE